MRRYFVSILAIFAALVLSACEKTPNGTDNGQTAAAGESGITYQLLVYSFADGIKNDKIGDIQGIIEHLDYIEALGASGIWLSPIHPCSSYHGYDVTTSNLTSGHIGYDEVNPKFGNDGDIYLLCEEAHKKGIKIYLDYVLNHTSSQHPWFLDAKKNTNSPYRDYYIFSNNPRSDIGTGKLDMIAKEGYNGYDAGQWFSTGTGSTMYHSHFWTGSFADINYGPAETCENSGPFIAIVEAAKHWIDLGVDGFRLDAVRHIYHNATSNENPVFLKKFYTACNDYYHSKGHTGDFYMVGENFENINYVAPYYAGLPALFDFSFWWNLRTAIQNGAGSGFPKQVLDNQARYDQYAAQAGWKAIDATKLSNHDENRAGTDLGKSIEKLKLAACVLLTSSGEPYIYQGEELGYWGDKSTGDEWIRTPINWLSDGSKQATGALNGKVDKAMLNAERSVEYQEKTETSILNVYRSFGKLRRTYPSMGKNGTMVIHTGINNKAVAAWYRIYGGEKMLVLHNFSSSTVSLTLSDDNLSNLVGSNGSVNVVPAYDVIDLGPYSSAVLKQ